MNIHSETAIRKTMLKTEKRDEIIRAALEIIAEHGFHGAPIAMIASRAGVGAGTIYRYFANKDILISVLYEDIEDRLFPYILQGYDSERPVRERFLHLGKALLQYFIENPLDFRYVEQFHGSPYGAALRRDRILGARENRDVFHEFFEEGISQQMIKDFPLTVIFDLAFDPVLYVVRDHILDVVKLDNVLITKIIEACWDGIRR